jgi:2-amino-4-hydroxy-6-hydroxymethyldihydropteridine diphosphokinase
MTRSVVVVGAGSNLGAREASIRAAGVLLDAREAIDVVAMSPLYETEPLGPPQPRYLNAAFRIETTLSPPALLRQLLRIEQRLGRNRLMTERWGPRSIDLDLLWDARGPFESEALRVPHGELERRSFALTPLVAVAPELERHYANALSACGGKLGPWPRSSRRSTRRLDHAFVNEAEAATVVDACALAASLPLAPLSPQSTIHRTVDSSATAFAAALHEVVTRGFVVRCTSISYCSNTQWRVHFHGANSAVFRGDDVCFTTTSGAAHDFGAALTVQRLAC